MVSFSIFKKWLDELGSIMSNGTKKRNGNNQKAFNICGQWRGTCTAVAVHALLLLKRFPIPTRFSTM